MPALKESIGTLTLSQSSSEQAEVGVGAASAWLAVGARQNNRTCYVGAGVTDRRQTVAMFGTVTPLDLRKAIAETLWAHVSAHDLADVCVFLGLKPQEKDENPFFSKRGYVGKRLLDKGIVELADLARRLVEEYGDQDLRQLVERLGPHGVSGELKNLIFSADGPKPRIVLRDAINNVIEIVENAEYCLVYDRPLAEHGLTWRELAVWWAQQHDLSADERTHARGLYERLCRSLANEAEHLLFRTYCALYGREGGFE